MTIGPTQPWPRPLPGSGWDPVSRALEPPPASLFRAYDLRALVDLPIDPDPERLGPAHASTIGRALGTMLERRGATRVVVGHDSRAYAAPLAASLVEGLLATGRDVVALGLATTPMVYLAQFQLDAPAGVAVSASHNPNGWGGFKIALSPGTTIGPREVAELQATIQAGDHHRGAGRYVEHSVTDRYIHELAALRPARPAVAVTVDGGNAVAGPIAVEAFRAAGHQVDAINLPLDWRVPNHEPDPERAEAQQQLADAVRHAGGIGVGLDGDGDRLGLIDERGRPILADRVVALLAVDALRRRPGGTIVHDVKCSRLVDDVVRRAGGTPVMCRTGHSHVRATVREHEAVFAGERSGHLFDTLDLHGIDDAINAALWVAQLLGRRNCQLADLVDELPQYHGSPTMHAACEPGASAAVLDRVADAVARDDRPRTIHRLDGVRAEFDDGWFLVRASTNLPELVIVCEGRDQRALERLYGRARELLAREPAVERQWRNDPWGGPVLPTSSGRGGPSGA